jgi:hypothetical protein
LLQFVIDELDRQMISRYTPANTTRKQIKEVCNLFLNTLAGNADKITTWPAVKQCGVVDGSELSEVQTGAVLNMLTTISHAHGLDYLSALCQESYGNIGGGFWNFIRRFGEDPDPWERENWVRERTKLLHENTPALTGLLQFIIGELDRND